MKVTWKKVALAAVVVAALYFLWPINQRAKIEKMLKEMAEQSSFSGDAHPFAQAEWAMNVSSRYSEDFKAVLIGQSSWRTILQGRSAVKEKFIILRKYMAEFKAQIVSVSVNVEGDEARADVRARGVGRTPDRSDFFMEEHAVRLVLRRIGRAFWEVTEVSNAEPIPDLEHLVDEQGESQ